MKTKIFETYLKNILSNEVAVTTYTAYLVDENMTQLTDFVGPFVASIEKDADGILMSISNTVWEWSGVSGLVRGVLILKENEQNAIFVDLEQSMAVDGSFTVNWSEVEFFRFKIDSMM
jgi:hypothetical protein